MAFKFQLLKKDPKSMARLGIIQTDHSTIETPVFMPVGTQATVKTLTKEELEAAGAHIILANTYHLWNQPGHKLIERAAVYKIYELGPFDFNRFRRFPSFFLS